MPASALSTQHTVEQAKALAFRAVDFLIEHDVPPIPLSYGVAYEYLSGGSPDLCKTLDDYLHSGRKIDAFVLRDLHERHLAVDRSTPLRSVGNDLQNLLGELSQNIEEAGRGAEEFGHALDTTLDHLADEGDAHSLRDIASGLLVATQKARQRNEHLQQRLQVTLAESEKLKVELERHRREALIDPLTGLWNRRAMDTELDELMAIEPDAPLSLLMLDIDHFKRINDTHGHALGDAVLRHVAEAIRKCLRSEDHAVRYGGEEFLVLLPHTPLVEAARVAESIRARVASLRLRRRSDNLVLEPFTVSLGVASRKPGDTRDSLLRRTDRALYRSKDLGRNRGSIDGDYGLAPGHA
jgi:diguanylate cyclase